MGRQQSALLTPNDDRILPRMRIDALSVANFRGIRRAEITDLGNEPLVTLSGRNGSGKSLILEAINLLWRADRLPSGLQGQWLLGSWGDELLIEMIIALTADERTTLEGARASLGGPDGPAPEHCKLRLRFHEGQGGGLQVDPWIDLLRRAVFGQDFLLGQIDHVPADRATSRGEAAQVNPSLLHDEQKESLRQQIVGSYAQQRQVTNVSGVAPLLATADYMDLLAEREGREASGDFDAIVDPFYAATGKSIHRPSADPGNPHGSVIQVDTPAGASHSLDQLSSGEQEVLSLSFLVRRLSSSGGVLLIDEPELHLHPALQQSLFAQLSQIADRAQVWIVTHSPRLVTSAPLGAILHMRGPSSADNNQLHRAGGEEDRASVLDDLGIHPIEILQSQFLVVVEGESDKQRLSSLLPVELSPSVTTVAGDASSVERVAQTLSSTGDISFLAIRDRDLMSDEKVATAEASSPNLFIWPNRMLENELLHPPLLAETLVRAGVGTTVGEVTDTLGRIAELQRDDVVAALVEAELVERFEVNVKATDSRLERVTRYIEEQRRIADEKLATFDAVVSAVENDIAQRWAQDFMKLADGKRMLREFSSRGPFRHSAGLVNAIITTHRDRPDLASPGLALLKSKVTTLALSALASDAE
jgi:hypothetical protein